MAASSPRNATPSATPYHGSGWCVTGSSDTGQLVRHQPGDAHARREPAVDPFLQPRTRLGIHAASVHLQALDSGTANSLSGSAYRSTRACGRSCWRKPSSLPSGSRSTWTGPSGVPSVTPRSANPAGEGVRRARRDRARSRSGGSSASAGARPAAPAGRRRSRARRRPRCRSVGSARGTRRRARARRSRSRRARRRRRRRGRPADRGPARQPGTVRRRGTRSRRTHAAGGRAARARRARRRAAGSRGGGADHRDRADGLDAHRRVGFGQEHVATEREHEVEAVGEHREAPRQQASVQPRAHHEHGGELDPVAPVDDRDREREPEQDLGPPAQEPLLPS